MRKDKASQAGKIHPLKMKALIRDTTDNNNAQSCSCRKPPTLWIERETTLKTWVSPTHKMRLTMSYSVQACVFNQRAEADMILGGAAPS